MGKKIQLHDYSEKLSFSSKEKLELKKQIWWSITLLIICALATYVVLRLIDEARCVEASGGYYESVQCGHDDCCEQIKLSKFQ